MSWNATCATRTVRKFVAIHIRAQLRKARVHFYGLGRFEGNIEIEASIDDVDDFKITALNVISREPDRTLICEMEFEVSLSLSLNIAAGRFEDSDSDMAWVFDSAEVSFAFDPIDWAARSKRVETLANDDSCRLAEWRITLR